MQIVINIPEGYYKTLITMKKRIGLQAEQYIINGTPLPKGHGDLYDDKALRKAFEEDGSLDAYKYATDRVSAIIEADKGEE